MLRDSSEDLINVDITAFRDEDNVSCRGVALDSNSERLQFFRILFAEYVLVKRDLKSERLNGRPCDNPLRVANAAVASPRVQLDIDSFVPFVLHPRRKQGRIVSDQPVFFLSPQPHVVIS